MPRFRWPYAALTLAYCAGIFYLSAQSEPPKPDVSVPGLDKLAHAVLFGGLAAVVALGLLRSNALLDRHVFFLIPVTFAVGYGLTDEIHQIYVPERSFDLLDLAADAAGALIVQSVIVRQVWKTPVRATLRDQSGA